MKSYSIQEINEILNGVITDTSENHCPEQLEAAKWQLKFHLLEIKKYENFGS
jgi:hypothetical protein